MPFYQPNYLQQAYDWLCQRRKNYHFNSDVWHLRANWETEKEKILAALKNGTYQLEAVTKISTPGRIVHVWSAKDALVLKMVAIHLGKVLAPILSDNIYHLAGTAEEKKGHKAAVQNVYAALPDYQFVFRTDVKGYYASIQHEVLFNICRQYIEDPFILKLIRQYLRHHVYDDGIYRSVQKGISLGCPLSPLMGALCLKPLDDAMEKTGLFYLRFMDDWVVLSPTRWKLRKAIATVNQCLNDLRFEKHPDKTSIGRTDNGFDFLGYHFQTIATPHPVVTTEPDYVPSDTETSSYCATTDEVVPLDLPTSVLSAIGIFDSTDLAIIKETTSSEVIAIADTVPTKCTAPQPTDVPNAPPKKIVRLSVAQKTIDNFLAKISQLYEQGASFERIGKYVSRWKQWVLSVPITVFRCSEPF